MTREKLPPFAEAISDVLAQRAPTPLHVNGATSAAVLVGLFEGHDGQPRLWLVRRPLALRQHSGQVALPGGKKDPTDLDLVATALREAREEIGLDPSSVSILGADDDYLTVTSYVVTPVVGWIRGPFSPYPNPAEVSHVFSVPFSLFHQRGLLRELVHGNLRRLVQIYEAEGEVIWGATAAILSGLARRCRSVMQMADQP